MAGLKGALRGSSHVPSLPFKLSFSLIHHPLIPLDGISACEGQDEDCSSMLGASWCGAEVNSQKTHAPVYKEN